MSDRLRNGYPDRGRLRTLGTSRSDQKWWPTRLDVETLDRNARDVGPRDDSDYGEAFGSLDIDAVEADVEGVTTTSPERSVSAPPRPCFGQPSEARGRGFRLGPLG